MEERPPVPPAPPIYPPPLVHPTVQRVLNRVRQLRAGDMPPGLDLQVDSLNGIEPWTVVGGSFRVHGNQPTITVNPLLAALDTEEGLAEVLGHELRHADQSKGLTDEQYIRELNDRERLPYKARPSEQEAYAEGNRIQGEYGPVPLSLEAARRQRVFEGTFQRGYAEPIRDVYRQALTKVLGTGK